MEFLLLICYFYTEPDVECFLLMMLMLVELHLRGLYVADFLLILCWSFDFVVTFFFFFFGQTEFRFCHYLHYVAAAAEC